MSDWLRVVNRGSADPVEMLIYDQIGKDWFDESGVDAKEFADELKEIPKNREILLRINSPGGNVHDGLAIHNMLARRRDHVDVVVDGIAASIASVIALSGRSLTMPKNALFMIHDPTGVVMGGSKDMRKMADVLDAHRDSIAGIYADHTGIPRARINAMMTEETWMDGTDAVSNKFATATDEPIQIAASFDFSCFQRVPETLKNQNQKAAANAAASKEQNEMKLREKTLALLQKAGIENVDAKSTDDQLFDQLEQLGNSLQDSKKADTTIKDEIKTLRDEIKNMKPKPDAPAPNVVDRAEFDKLKAQYEAERQARIRNEVTALCAKREYLDVDDEIAMAIKDDSYIANIRKRPEDSGVAPLKPITGGANSLVENYKNMEKGADRMKFRVANFGELQRIRKTYGPQDANTLDANLVTDFLSDALITVAHNKLAMMNAFSVDFGIDRMKPLSVVQVRKVTAGATVQTNATNFEDGDSTTVNVPITVAQKTASFHILNSELQSGHRLQHLAEYNAFKLADAISDVVTALFLTGTYGTPVTIGTAANFDSADLPPIWAAAKDFKAKNLLLDGGHLAYLLPTSKESFRLGEQGAYNFDLIVENNRWTGATANTQGFICGPDAVAVASGLPVDTPSSQFLAQSVTTLKNNLSVESLLWYNTAGRVHWASYDVMFGAAAGDVTQGLGLITA